MAAVEQPNPPAESIRSRVRTLLTSPLVLVVALFAVAALWLDRPFSEKATLGSILVDTPEIYTRERLVNDRFLQDAWLSARLDPPEIHDGRQVRDEMRRAMVQTGGSEPPPQAGASPDGTKGTPQSVEPRLASRIRLLDQVDYRDVVRNLLIENQLDDRHDLNGNSLYKLKFDTSILPGVNTQAAAHISVRLMPPAFLADHEPRVKGSLHELGTKADVEAWRKIYARWIENLRSRLNQTHYELKDAYRNNEFSHNDYVRLIEFLSLHLRVPLNELPECPAHLVDSHGQDSTSVRLSTQEYAIRKNCVRALVGKTLPRTVTTASVPIDSKVGSYFVKPKVNEAPDLDRPRRIDDTVDLWLNSFFAARTVKLVLGVSVPEASFVARGFHDIPMFQNLARLAFFNSEVRPSQGSVFHVSEKVFPVVAIDSTKLGPGNLEKLDLEQVRGQKHEDFIATDYLPAPHFISRLYLAELQGDGFKFSKDELQDVSQGRGVYVLSAEVGLLKFARLARLRMAAFTYGVSPKESADTVYLNLSTQSNVGSQVPGAADKALGTVQLQREVNARSVERRSGVVGFSGVPWETKPAQSGAISAAQSPRHAEFGWLISPRQVAMNGREAAYIQAPAQYALSALVSIPSWWHAAVFEVTTSWVGKDGEITPNTKRVSRYEIEVPTDFEPLEALLLGIEQLGPEIMESRLDPIWLTACRGGAIVIPGRRLWRSTKVTLGHQTADAISVLPNMKGIIATFDVVENQLSVAEEAAWRRKQPTGAVQIQRAVRVWTSQGSLTLPTLATIGVPAGAPESCPKPRPTAATAVK